MCAKVKTKSQKQSQLQEKSLEREHILETVSVSKMDGERANGKNNDQRSADKKQASSDKSYKSEDNDIVENDQRSSQQDEKRVSDNRRTVVGNDKNAKATPQDEEILTGDNDNSSLPQESKNIRDAAGIEDADESAKNTDKNDESHPERYRKDISKSKNADIDQDIPDPVEPRHRQSLWLWWLIGFLALALIGAGAYLVIAQPWVRPQDSSTQDENQPKDTEQPDTPAEEEQPNEPEDPDQPAEDPSDPKPSESEPTNPSDNNSMPPIAQRPGSSDYPEITSNKLIALTFDDGPSSATTPRLLDTLKNKNVKATFFVLGNLAQRSPDIIRREAAEGHEVASHTPYHDQLTRLTASQVRAQALEMDRIFTDILGTVPPFTRPPYGSYDDSVRSALGQPLIIWSIDPRDWADRDVSIVCSRVTSAAFDGAIILVHDIHATTVDAVPCIIDNLRAQGYQFLTVSELAAAKDTPLINGGVYGKF